MKCSIYNIFSNNISILGYSDKTITYLRLQNFYKALFYSNKTIDNISHNLDNILVEESYFNGLDNILNFNYINEMLNSLLQAQENKDYILLADFFEMQLNPFIISLQEFIIANENLIFNEEQYINNINLIKSIDSKLGSKIQQMNSPLELLSEGYSVEFTSCGLMTLALYKDDKKYYLHSNGQVMHEANMLAREWFSDNISEYIIYGLGFGYHVMELKELDDSIKINIYESDLRVIQLACAFTNLKTILSTDRVRIIYDPQFNELSKSTLNLANDSKYVIHYPSLRNIRDSKIREQLEDYFVSYSSINNQLHSLNNNFRKNIYNYDSYVDCLNEQFKGKDLYIIAAGPSLDKNFMYLKNLDKNSIILTTGTVLKKLLYAGINPDFVIMIDANVSVLNQIKDAEDSQIPLLYLSTVYYKVPEVYQGKKYLICQEGFPKAEDYANTKGYHLYQTGGSVSTTALDIGIQFGCKRIIFLGLDLAYSNNLDHAIGTDLVSTVINSDLRQIEDIYGNLVGTSKNLDIYRKWIERRIENVKGIEFIDATEGGAKKRGMKIRKVSECLKDNIN